MARWSVQQFVSSGRRTGRSSRHTRPRYDSPEPRDRTATPSKRSGKVDVHSPQSAVVYLLLRAYCCRKRKFLHIRTREGEPEKRTHFLN